MHSKHNLSITLSTGQDAEGAAQYIDRMRAICDRITANGGVLDTTIDHNLWLAYYDLLTSPNTFSGDIRTLNLTITNLGLGLIHHALPSLTRIQPLFLFLKDHFMILTNLNASLDLSQRSIDSPRRTLWKVTTLYILSHLTIPCFIHYSSLLLPPISS